MEIKTKLTLRAMIRWEQMTGRSFQDIRFTDEEDARKAMYCASVVYADTPYTYDEFVAVISNRKIAGGYAKAMARYNEYVTQFASAETAANDSSGAPIQYSIGEVAANLIVNGLDAHFVLDEMTAGDIPLYFEAINEKMKHAEESHRLWTYFIVTATVGSKKIKSPQDLYKFPWEMHHHTVTQAERERAISEFKDFMAGKIG